MRPRDPGWRSRGCKVHRLFPDREFGIMKLLEAPHMRTPFFLDCHHCPQEINPASALIGAVAIQVDGTTRDFHLSRLFHFSCSVQNPQ